MGDTLTSMEPEISQININFKIYDKGNMVVILSQTKLAINTFFWR